MKYQAMYIIQRTNIYQILGQLLILELSNAFIHKNGPVEAELALSECTFYKLNSTHW